MFSKTLCAVGVLILVDVILSSDTWEKDAAAWKKKNKIPKQVFKLEGPGGPSSIKTYDEAVQLCKDEGGEVAENWRLRDSVKSRGYEKCGPCGWLKMAKHYVKNYRPICGDEGKDGKTWHIRCAHEPADEGLEGYDVYCYGKSGPQLPPDAVAINVGENRGYVFVIESGQNKVYETLSKASSQCIGRGAVIANSLQIKLGWYNGMSSCFCGWMENYSGMPMNDKIPSCGDRISYIGCPHGELRHVYCFVDARAEPRGINVVSFANMNENVYPMGIEDRAVQIDGGYVYSTKNMKGPNEVKNIFEAYHTCKIIGASVATPEQLQAAQGRGMEWCGCSWTWENAELFMSVMVRGTGGVYKISNGKCGTAGLVKCPMKNDDGDGWDVFCYKGCPAQCPPPAAWNIPQRSVKIPGGRVFHVEGETKYAFGTKTAANDACQAKMADLATSQQLKMAQLHGLTKCRCGYLADDKVAFPMYRPIQGCGGNVGVFDCPGTYPDIPEQGPDWDAYCFISDQQMSSLDSYDETLVPEVEAVTEAPEEEVEDWHFIRPDGMKRMSLEGLSMVQKARQEKRKQDKLERIRLNEERKAEKARKAKERKAEKARKEAEARLLKQQERERQKLERQRQKLERQRQKSAAKKSKETKSTTKEPEKKKSESFNPTKQDFHGLTRLEKQAKFLQSLDYPS